MKISLLPATIFLTACGGIVEPAPLLDSSAPVAEVRAPAASPARAAWADHLCGARPVAVSSARADVHETREREDYPGAPWVVRTFDGTRPSELRRACVRDRSATACTCRELGQGEVVYAERL